MVSPIVCHQSYRNDACKESNIAWLVMLMCGCRKNVTALSPPFLTYKGGQHPLCRTPGINAYKVASTFIGNTRAVIPA